MAKYTSPAIFVNSTPSGAFLPRFDDLDNSGLHIYTGQSEFLFTARLLACALAASPSKLRNDPVKTHRHSAIRELLLSTTVVNQDDLRRKLAGRGIHVTQATLSRDLRELKLLKGPEGYALPDADRAEPDADFDDTLPAVAEMLQSFGLEVRQAENMLVLLTAKGAAGPVAAGIDDEEWPEALGTVAGDNTVLIVCVGRPAADALRARLEAYLA